VRLVIRKPKLPSIINNFEPSVSINIGGVRLFADSPEIIGANGTSYGSK